MSRFRSERDRLQYEAWKRQDEEEQQRPIKQAGARLSRTVGELIRVQRSNLLDIRDPDFFASPGLENITMEMEAAQRFNREEAAGFVRENPDYFPSQKNFELLASYMERNGCTIIDRAMWKAAVQRFKAVGLLDERTEPETVVEPVQVEPDVNSLPRLPLSHQTQAAWRRDTDGSQEGFDLNSGEKRMYTSFQIDRMTADEYRRAFRLSIPALTKANFTK